MKALESFNVLESFGFGTNDKGVFQEISEVEMADVIGGSCGGGCGCGFFYTCMCEGVEPFPVPN